jgi:enoyl-CoA hydratase/carnithine racemase
LVGKRIEAADLMYTGLATHYVPSKHLPDLETALVKATISEGSQQSDDALASVLMSFNEPIDTQSSFLAKSQTLIDQTFNEDTVEDIFSNLEKGDTDFCKDTLASLKKLSPTSLKVSLEGLRRGSELGTIGEDLQMEYRMASACTRPGSDFYEGVRSVLVDKDHSPKWNPSSVEEVTKEMVDAFFSPLDVEWPIPQQPSKL